MNIFTTFESLVPFLDLQSSLRLSSTCKFLHSKRNLLLYYIEKKEEDFIQSSKNNSYPLFLLTMANEELKKLDKKSKRFRTLLFIVKRYFDEFLTSFHYKPRVSKSYKFTEKDKNTFIEYFKYMKTNFSIVFHFGSQPIYHAIVRITANYYDLIRYLLNGCYIDVHYLYRLIEESDESFVCLILRELHNNNIFFVNENTDPFYYEESENTLMRPKKCYCPYIAPCSHNNNIFITLDHIFSRNKKEILISYLKLYLPNGTDVIKKHIEENMTFSYPTKYSKSTSNLIPVLSDHYKYDNNDYIRIFKDSIKHVAKFTDPVINENTPLEYCTNFAFVITIRRILPVLLEGFFLCKNFDPTYSNNFYFNYCKSIGDYESCSIISENISKRMDLSC